MVPYGNVRSCGDMWYCLGKSTLILYGLVYVCTIFSSSVVFLVVLSYKGLNYFVQLCTNFFEPVILWPKEYRVSRRQRYPKSEFFSQNLSFLSK